jgi:hypothetical protein
MATSLCDAGNRHEKIYRSAESAHREANQIVQIVLAFSADGSVLSPPIVPGVPARLPQPRSRRSE